MYLLTTKEKKKQCPTGFTLISEQLSKMYTGAYYLLLSPSLTLHKEFTHSEEELDTGPVESNRVRLFYIFKTWHSVKNIKELWVLGAPGLTD